MSAVSSDPPRSRRIRRATVGGALRAWLNGRELLGADRPRAQLALWLAHELDSGTPPPYARARVAGELRAVIGELEGSSPPPAGGREASRRRPRLAPGSTTRPTRSLRFGAATSSP